MSGLLGEVGVVASVEQDVGRLDVTVKEAPLVDEVKSVGYRTLPIQDLLR